MALRIKNYNKYIVINFAWNNYFVITNKIVQFLDLKVQSFIMSKLKK